MSEVKMPEDYKQTEVGVIPKDWEVEPLKSLLKEPPKYGINAAAVPLTGNLPVYIRITDISEDGYYSPEKVVGVNSPFSSSYILNEGDIVLARTGASVGKSYLYRKEDGTLIYAGFLIKVSPNEKQLNPKYLHQYLKTEQYWAWVIVNSMRSGQPGINGNEYGRLLIPLPSIEEQTAIATALSDVDNLIGSLEKLIAKKEAIKTGTMQQLLTGKTRLPEFATRDDGNPKGFKQTELGRIPEDWALSTMREVIYYCSAGATPYRGNESFYKGTNRWITSGELNYCVINDTIEKISDNAIEKTNLKIHPTGTFLMAITGLEAAGTRGSCGIIGKPSTTNQSCMAIYPNKHLTSKYLYHWYVYNGNELALKYCQGTKQMSYTAGLIQRLPIYLPMTTKEQTAIATILSNMDAEIQALQQRLEKTKDIKQGMMQQLLTGKVRLTH
ncbi:restriction endonuclease subunit S [Psychrobacter piscatorii]|uniref:restriction endonuclease subunit S n=1 Tax=Psychrobacter piscatorii TaxID=554343 RepID=UPI0019180ADC|nr:restriction endonuclease subunit S [Psychrobacter piscatorii]